MNNNQLGVIDWEDFERAAKSILQSAGAQIEKFKVNGKKKFLSEDGEYEIDASVEFTMLGGASFFVLAECRAKKSWKQGGKGRSISFSFKNTSIKGSKGNFLYYLRLSKRR